MLSIVHDHDVYTEGYDEGFDNGFDSGATNTIISLFKKGTISKDIAIRELNVSETDFINMVQEYKE